MKRAKGVENVNRTVPVGLYTVDAPNGKRLIRARESAHLGAQVPHDARHDDRGACEDQKVELFAVEHPAHEGDQRNAQEVERDDDDRVRDAQRVGQAVMCEGAAERDAERPDPLISRKTLISFTRLLNANGSLI